ncbi:MAG: FKBP-type peptidyl-prolyl cis-trans isomerase [Sphingomonadales bacterium]|jgi:FKBP-type peptidyl-prolyl cis-trans isomerase
MNFVKKHWLTLSLVLLILASLAFFLRKPLGIWLGGWEKTQRGGYFRVVEGKKWDKMPGAGYHIVFQYVLTGPEGDTLVNLAKPGVEQHMMYPVEPRNELEDAMQNGAPGSVVEVLIPTDSLKQRISGNLQIMNLPSGENAKFIIRIIKVLNDAQYAGYQNQRFMERLQKENKLIDDFAARMKKPWLLDSTRFIKYFIENKTQSPRFTEGRVVSFHAEVATLDGRLLINSAPTGKKYLMEIGKNTYNMAAFDQILQYMSEGETGVFLVTSDYGYGDQGYMNIVKPYTPLMIKITDLTLSKP